MDDFSFSLPGADERPRRAFRAAIPGVEAYVAKLKRSFPIKDLSAVGMGIQVGNESALKTGETFTFDLMLNKRVYLSEISAKVMRSGEGGILGCAFDTMEKHKEVKLDKLVLEVQKRFITLRKAQQDKEES